MARHQPKPLRKGLPVDLEALRTPRLTKAPDVDPVLVQPTSRLSVVPDVPTPEEPVPATEDGNADVSATPGTVEGRSVENADVSATPGTVEGRNVEGADVSAQPAEPETTVPLPAVDHPAPQTPQPPTVQQPVQGGEVSATQPRAEAPAKKKSSGKITIQLKPEEAARVRAAFANLPAKVRPRSLGAFAAVPIMEYVRQIEEEYNGGEPFDPIEPGVLPTGRPLGS